MVRFVQNEETTANRVSVGGGWNFYEVTNDFTVGDFNSMLFIADVPLDDEQLNHFAGAIGYAWQATVRGEHMPTIHRHGDNGFYVFVSLSSSSRSNPGEAFLDFVDMVEEVVNAGSPLRKNKTRKVEPLPFEQWVTVSIWVDEIEETVQDSYVPSIRPVEVPTNSSALVQEDIANLRSELQGVAALPNLTSREKYFMEIAEKALSLAESNGKKVVDSLESLKAVVKTLS